MKTVKNTIFRGVNPFEDYPFDSTLVDYQGWGSDHPILTTLIDILRPKLILEVGTWKGLSAIYMANCIKSLNLETEIVCIDIWLGSPEHWLPKN